MVDKPININDIVNKKDIEIILEVNRKAIEIGSENAEQNEEIIKLLNESKESHNKFYEKNDSIDKKADSIIKQNETLSRDLFTIKILYVAGILGLVTQIIQIFLKK